MPKVAQTAGREQLGDFAPMFAALNDDVLFGEVWSDDALTLKMRSALTITTLVAKGLVDASFEYHIQTAKGNGITANHEPPFKRVVCPRPIRPRFTGSA